jgi:outer membrane autotransporter protein
MLRLKERREQERQPRAPAGSADATSGLRGASVFVAGEFEAFEKDITRFEPGYRSESGGGTLGADYAFTNWMVAGAAFNYTHVEGNVSRSSGGFETDSYGGLVYAGFVPARGFFIDAVLGYARKDYLIDREIAYATNTLTAGSPRTRNGIAAGQTSGDQYTAGVNAGYDFIVRNLTIGPRVGLNYMLTTVNGFTERGRRASGCDPFVGCRSLPATGLELTYERQAETSLTSVGGVFASLAISTVFGVIIPQTTFEYVHEFQDDQRSIRFRFAEDLNRTKLRFSNDPPDRDYFHTSVGLVFVLPSGLSPFINYRTLLGYRDYTRHAVTAGLRFSF